MRRRAATAVLAAPLTSAALGAPGAEAARVIATPLRTRGARIVDAPCRTVVLQGVNWFGFETSNHLVHGLWSRDCRDMLAQIRRLGFNATGFCADGGGDPGRVTLG